MTIVKSWLSVTECDSAWLGVTIVKPWLSVTKRGHREIVIKFDWVLQRLTKRDLAWRSLCKTFFMTSRAWPNLWPWNCFISFEHFREDTEEYNIPDGVENRPDLLQQVKPPIYNEPGVRVVELNREPDSGLGISIIGGKAGPQGLGLKGIFIRHVLESSPAARLGTLVTGDQILEVGVSGS